MGHFEEDIVHCLQVLAAGGTILYPTDTIWGIGCDATNSEAVKKVYSIKSREAEKSLIVLVAGEKDILRYVSAPDPSIAGFLQRTSRPTTVLYDGAIGLAPEVMHADGSVGIRVVREQFCRHLILRFRKPIVSTSANISGEPSPKIFNEISSAVRQGVDYIVKYRQDDVTASEPSSIVRWQSNGVPIVIR